MLQIQEAIALGKPVVALESTIISHGMPYPRNLEVAKAVEQIVRNGGAVPATIAVIHGIPRIGLSDEHLLLLASNHNEVRKASTRDLAFVCAKVLLHSFSTSTISYLIYTGIPCRNDSGKHHEVGSTRWDSRVRDWRHWRCPSRR
jgi:pseudouridylate synthase